MDPFSTVAWKRIHKIYSAGTSNSLERWVLRYAHRPNQLNYLAAAIGRYVASQGQSACVQIDSLWIDGTPQARSGRCNGPHTSCELGDLLIVVDRFTKNGGVLSPLDSRALIVQAKISASPLALPVGQSTKKERRLLEESCAAKGISLWRGVVGATAKIGAYALPPACQGLGNYATYLLVPKQSTWAIPYPTPFVCAWPPLPFANATNGLISYVQTLQKLSHTPVYGHLLSNPATCEWSRMVHDLLQGYKNVWMNGYGGQHRINQSRIHCSVANSASPPLPSSPAAPSALTPSAALTLSAGGFGKTAVGPPHSGPVSASGRGGGDRPRPTGSDEASQGPAISVVRVGIIVQNSD